MLLPFDCHLHTYYSPCGRKVDECNLPVARPELYLQQAARIGLQAMVFADHFVQNPAARGMIQFYKGSGPAILASLRSELERLTPPDGCEIYVGCETETLSTEWVGVDAAYSEKVDFVLVPTTHYHLPGSPQPASWAPQDVADHMLTMLEAVVGKPWLDSVAHPLSESEEIVGDLRAIYEMMDRGRLSDILGLAGENGVALEVNGAALRSSGSPNYSQVYAEVVRLAKARGVRFTYGSDAHDYRNLGITAATEAWLSDVGLSRADFLTPAELRAKRR